MRVWARCWPPQVGARDEIELLLAAPGCWAAGPLVQQLVAATGLQRVSQLTRVHQGVVNCCWTQPLVGARDEIELLLAAPGYWAAEPLVQQLVAAIGLQQVQELPQVQQGAG